MLNRLNGRTTQTIISGLALAAALGAWGFVRSRASAKDVQTNKDNIVLVLERVRATEANVSLICQFIDREDKLAGGPGLDCKDPE